jgi:hypothetical protein
MRPLDLLNPQTEEQKAENAAYIARECERIQATWTEHDERRRRGIYREPVLSVAVIPLKALSNAAPRRAKRND